MSEVDRSGNSNPNWLVRLKAVYNSLKSAEKRAADLLLQDAAASTRMTITEIADASNVSEATFVRLAKRIGYKGYRELKAEMRSAPPMEETSLYPNISPEDTYADLLAKVTLSSVKTLQDTLNVVDIGQFEKAIKALSKAKRIAFYALGDASAVALTGHYKLQRIGWQSSFFSDPDLALITASHLEPGDVGIGISYSGRTASVIHAIKRTREMGATTIGITNFPLSPLAKICDIMLLTAAFADPMEFRSVEGDVLARRIAQLCILEALYVALLLKEKPSLKAAVRHADEALHINKV